MSDRTGTSVVLIQNRDAPKYKEADTKKSNQAKQNHLRTERKIFEILKQNHHITK